MEQQQKPFHGLGVTTEAERPLTLIYILRS